MVKNKTLAIASAVLIVIMGFFVSTQSSMSPTKIPTNSQVKKESLSENKIENYIPYNPDSFLATANKRRVLFFYASWCVTCKPANANFQQNANLIPSDVAVFRVNYNDSDTDSFEKELAKKYQVTYQHTFVQVDKNGIVVTKWNGGQVKDLLQKIK